MKKFLISVCFGFALLFCTQGVYAADSNHVIKTWHSDIHYRADNVVEVTESITVDYLNRQHGFFRFIPYIVAVEKEIDGELREMRYRARISNVSVQGAKFKKSTENDFVVLQMGDEDETVFGLQDYVISYTMDMGDDRVADYDEMFYSLLGSDNAALVESFSFDVTFEKPIPNPAEIAMFSGYYGETNKDGVEFAATANGVSGYSLHQVDTGSAVTMYLRLPEGYFENERVVTPAIPYLILIIVVLLLVLGIVLRIMQGRKNPVVTVEFSAPEGISSAEVGYIVDSSCDDKDILSLIIYFADKGFISISGEEENVVLHKIRNLPSSSPRYMTTFFDSLFAGTEERALSTAGVSVYEGITTARMQLPKEFCGERSLYASSGSVLSLILPFLTAPLYLIGILIATDRISDAGNICALFGAIALACSGIICSFAQKHWTFASLWSRALTIIGALVPLAIGGGLSIICSTVSITGFPFYSSALFAACALASFICSQLANPSKYNTEISGKLLGLKNFIQTAELDRLKVLAADTPQYFYNILPYAYVFGLTDVWVKQFENIVIPEPTWSTGATTMSYANIYWLTRGMDRARTNMATEMATQQAKSGGKGGTSFGGGGGFSGGGFGGGGSGSW